MTGEILIKTINQGARSGIPVVVRPKLTLNRIQPSSANSKTTDTPVETVTADSASAAAADTAITTDKSAASVCTESLSFDMELLTRLKNCNPALTLLTTAEVAAIFRASVKKFENDRYQKRGLKYIKIAGTVRYRLSHILAELDAQIEQ